MKIANAILAINPNAKIAVHHQKDDLDTCTIEWHDSTPEISKANIKTKMDELQAEYDAKEYQRKRKAEYPSTADQLDDIYHNGIDGWKATIKVTKDKYPK